MPTIVKGQPTSEEIRRSLAEEGRPVLVAMSLGKDAIAAELALQDAGIKTHLAYMYLIPPGEDGKLMSFLEDTISSLEDTWQKRIHRYPHPSVYRWLNSLVFQPPERCSIIEAAKLPEPDYQQLWALVKNDLNLEQNTWVADGVRAADSIVRRASFSRHGVMKTANHKVSPIYDWLKAEVMGRISQANVKLPIDYQWFGRSFDGLDHRFLAPLKENAPKDYQRVLDWFPLAELESYRHEHYTA